MKITDKHGQQWQLVPLDPTESIERAYYWQQEKSGFLNCYPVYKAMLSAAPEPELPEGLEPVAWEYASHISGACTLTHQSPDSLIEPDSFQITPLVLQSAALAEIAKRDAEIAQGIEGPHHYRQNNVKLRQELAEISAALDDPRSDLTMTMPEIIKDLRDRVQRQAALIEKFHFAIESMRVAGGHVEFQAAFDRAKELLHD